MSVTGPYPVGMTGHYVNPDVPILVWKGVGYPLPRLRFGDVNAQKLAAQQSQDLTFRDPSWHREKQYILPFMVRSYDGALPLTALNRTYLWEVFFTQIIGIPVCVLHPFGTTFYGVLTNFKSSEVDSDHCIMELTFDVIAEYNTDGG